MDRNRFIEKLKHIDITGKTKEELYREISNLCMGEIAAVPKRPPVKTIYYFSIEFLMGRMFFNNLMALGVLDETREILAQKGIDISLFEDVEDAALGNGGLGRLAACYLDSAAHFGFPMCGFGIYYRYGLFSQRIENGRQKEDADDWLKNWGDPWTVRRENEKFVVHFADMDVTAVPYDMPIYGKNVNTLRLFRAEGSPEAEKISDFLYPADDNDDGKLLRIRQEYFFSAAAVGQLVKKFAKKNSKNFDSFPDMHVFHLNDTHAVFAIAEFLRLLTKEYKLTVAQAVEIAQKTFVYTNHTVLPEALECWDMRLVEQILPEIAQILKTLHLYAVRRWTRSSCLVGDIAEMSIIQGDAFSMANIAVYISKSVNGVSKLHSHLLKEKLFVAAYKYTPAKFTNVTNGVTPRRWLMLCNEELASFYDKTLGRQWREDLKELCKLDSSNKDLLDGFAEVKAVKKRQLATYIEQKEGVNLLPDAIYLSQVKRFHEYKRQLMTAFAVLSLYFAIKDGGLCDLAPMVFIFGGKAASGYTRAKAVIKFINDIAELVNGDGEVNRKLQVVFVKNYGVSYAEKIIPATDVSLQVSTAGYEASGTGNMKFMMNGAVTLGTYDGANIEIVEQAGDENNYLFGAPAEAVSRIRKLYDPKALAEKDPKIKRVTDALKDGTFRGSKELQEIYRATFTETYNSADHFLTLGYTPEYVQMLHKKLLLFLQNKIEE